MWDPEGLAEPRSRCTVCGLDLTGDPDDDPWHPGGPLCGDCWRARAADELQWALDATEREGGP